MGNYRVTNAKLPIVHTERDTKIELLAIRELQRFTLHG